MECEVTEIYAGGDQAYLRWVGPEWDVASARSVGEARRDLRSLPIAPRRVWLTSEVGTPGSRPWFHHERAPYLAGWGDRSTLYLLEEEQ